VTYRVGFTARARADVLEQFSYLAAGMAVIEQHAFQLHAGFLGCKDFARIKGVRVTRTWRG
jgi:hypothetical protein